MSNKIIKKDELKDLIVKASELSEQERKQLSNQYSLEEIKKIAWEYDIDSSKVEEAYQAMQEKKEIRKLVLYITICFLLVGSVATFALWPRPFKGKLELTVTSAYEPTTLVPDDHLDKLEIYRHNTFYALISIFKMEYTHDFRLELLDPNGEIKKLESTEIYGENSKTGQIEFYVPLSMPIGAQTGDWKMNIYIDDELYTSKKLPVTYGDMEISFASEVYYNGKPIEIKSVFNEELDKEIECHIFWPVLSGEHLLEWKWYAPNGTMHKHHSIKLIPVGGKSYWANNRIENKDLEAGRWKVEVYMASIKIGEKEFIVD